MQTIRITDDLSATKVSVVKLRCTCLWEDKTFRDGCIPFAVQHFVSKHGGNGKIAYGESWRLVENGRLSELTHTS